MHRPGYDDWTFPKGKVDPDDVDEEHTALREVAEETGYRCTLGRELPGTDYLDRKGRPKHVRYWEMRPLAGAFPPNDEVDEVRWLAVAEARRQLTYAHDRARARRLRPLRRLRSTRTGVARPTHGASIRLCLCRPVHLSFTDSAGPVHRLSVACAAVSRTKETNA